jgi:hypothetical protein
MDAAGSDKKASSPNIQFNLINQSGVPLKAEQQSSQIDVDKAVLGIVIKGFANNTGGFRDALSGGRG